MTGVSKSITALQEVTPTNIETPGENSEVRFSPEQGSFNPDPAIGAYNSLYCPTAMVLSGIPYCLPSGYPVWLAPSLLGEIFTDQITGDISTYHYVANKLFTSSGEIDHDKVEYLQMLLRNQNQNWLKITVLCWTYQNPTNSPMFYTEWQTGHWFYSDINKEYEQYK